VFRVQRGTRFATRPAIPSGGLVMTTRVRGVLLDLDGTLVESNDAHAHAWERALTEGGFTVTFDQVRPLIGMGGDKLLPEVCGLDAESSKGKAVSKRRREIFLKEYLPLLRATPGTAELLRALKASGLKLAVASSAEKAELDPLMKLCGADKVVETATGSDDAEGSKPDPDIIHAALKRVGLPADAAVLLGDTPYDVEAARRAGVQVIAVRCGGWADAELNADAVYADPRELLDHFKRTGSLL